MQTRRKSCQRNAKSRRTIAWGISRREKSCYRATSGISSFWRRAWQPRRLPFPLPYRQSRTPTPQAKYISLTHVRIGTRDSSNSILLRTIAKSQDNSTTITSTVEDAQCKVASLTGCNLENSPSDPVVAQYVTSELVLEDRQREYSTTRDFLCATDPTGNQEAANATL